MTRIEIGALVALAVAVITGAISFGNLQGRVSSIEREIDSPKKVMRDEGRQIVEETENIHKEFMRDTEAIRPDVEANDLAISSLGENDCKWMSYVDRFPSKNVQHCPDGFYAKGLGFYHEGGENYAYQMRYRLYCCSLRKKD